MEPWPQAKHPPHRQIIPTHFPSAFNVIHGDTWPGIVEIVDCPIENVDFPIENRGFPIDNGDVP
jgi:hypothetical protein